MAKQLVAAAIIQQHQLNGVMLSMQMTSSDIFMKRERRDKVTRVQNFYEITVPNYSLDDFKSHFRLSRETFDVTYARLQRTAEFNRKRGPIPNVEKDLLMYLWYIGNLESIRSMSDRFNVSKSTFHETIRRTSSALVSLMPYVIKWPGNIAELNETSNQFSQHSQLQNVIGAVDGSHIPIKAPKHLPHVYFNRKKFYSIVLLGICNANMEFTYVWTGNPGSTHDATVLRSSDIFSLSDQKIPQGFYLLGDSAFQIMRWLITPFRNTGNMTRQQRLFNKTHCRCREVIERAFGLLKSRFRRLLRLEVSDKSILIDTVLSACVLHNLCISVNDLLDTELPNQNDDDVVDDGFAREGHEIQGIQLRQQIVNQLLSVN